MIDQRSYDEGYANGFQRGYIVGKLDGIQEGGKLTHEEVEPLNIGEPPTEKKP